ncbi:MAG: hypothetical protein ACC656_06805 [Candidatus Heimdallarchaeota archaeon]
MPDLEQKKNLTATVLIGEVRNGNPVWGLPYDPYNSYSDGQFRVLFMRLQKLLLDPEFKMNKHYTLASGIPGCMDQAYILC